MYNAEQKTGFIRWYTQDTGVAAAAAGLFDRFEQYEQSWQADLCTRKHEELQPAVDSLIASNPPRLWDCLTVLRAYIRWCVTEKIPEARDGWALVEIEELNKVRQRMVSSPAHLQKYLDEVFHDEREQMVDNVYRCYYWMAFGGIKDEDMPGVRTSDVSLPGMCIRYNGAEYPIYREALPAFINAIELTSFRYEHPLYDDTISRDRAEGDILIRGFGRNSNLKYIKTNLSHISAEAIKQGKTQLQLGYYRVWMSGLFYRIYEAEKGGREADFSDVVKSIMEHKSYVINGRTKIEHRHRQRARSYLESYKRWKLAFSL